MAKRKKKIQYDVKAVVYLLKERAALEALKDKGDITATQILVDLDGILREAEPTVKQAKAVELVWVRGYTLNDAGAILKITPQGVYFNLKLLKKKIKAVTERWADNGKYIV